MNSKLLILSIFLFLITSLSSIAALPGSQSTAVTQSPPFFTSTAPSASHMAGNEFIYNFSAFDPDLDPISFFIAGEEQSDATYQAEGYWATSAQTSIWQSFTADSTGFLTTAGILCYSSNTESDSVYIYSGSGTGGSVLYKAPLPMMNFYDYHTISIPVSSGVIIASGSTYTIEFKSTSNAIITYMEQNYLGNPYPGGRGYFSEDSDHPFITRIKPLKTFSVAAWPTLTDNGNGTGSLVGTPPGSAIGTFSEILIAKAGSDYVQQPISFEITNPVLAPSGLFAIAADGQIELKWNKNAPANFGKYYIYGSTEPNPTSLIDSSSSVSDTTLILSGLTNGTLYYFRLNAKSNGGVASGFSNEDAAVPQAGEGNALSFDGDGDYVSIPNLSAILSGKTALTISGWVYPRNPEGSFPDFDHFFGFRNDSDADFYVMQSHGTNLKAVIRTSSGAGEIPVRES